MGSCVIVIFVALTLLLSFADMLTSFVIGFQAYVNDDTVDEVFYKPREDRIFSLMFVAGPGVALGIFLWCASTKEEGWLVTYYSPFGSTTVLERRTTRNLWILIFMIIISPIMLPLVIMYCGGRVFGALCKGDRANLMIKCKAFALMFTVESIVVSNTLALVQLFSISKLNEWDLLRVDAALSSLTAVAWGTALIPWAVLKDPETKLSILEFLAYICLAFWIFVHLLVIYVPVCFLAGQNGHWPFVFAAAFYFPIHFSLFIVFVYFCKKYLMTSFLGSLVLQLVFILFSMFFILTWFGSFLEFLPDRMKSEFAVELWNDATLPWMRDFVTVLSGAIVERNTVDGSVTNATSTTIGTTEMTTTVNGSYPWPTRRSDFPKKKLAWNVCTHVDTQEATCLMDSASLYFVFLFFVSLALFAFNIIFVFVSFGRRLLERMKKRCRRGNDAPSGQDNASSRESRF